MPQVNILTAVLDYYALKLSKSFPIRCLIITKTMMWEEKYLLILSLTFGRTEDESTRGLWFIPTLRILQQIDAGPELQSVSCERQ